MDVRRLDAGGLALVLGNDIAEIAAALPTVQRFGALADLAPRVQNRIEVIFEELASNPIRHGFTPGSAQRIEITLTVTAETVTLVFEDGGPAFDPLARAAPAPLRDLALAPEGGLGIAMVRRLASEVRYEALLAGNRVTVVLAR
jgi:serine/threonine-protein kinase RsbW